MNQYIDRDMLDAIKWFTIGAILAAIIIPAIEALGLGLNNIIASTECNIMQDKFYTAVERTWLVIAFIYFGTMFIMLFGFVFNFFAAALIRNSAAMGRLSVAAAINVSKFFDFLGSIILFIIVDPVRALNAKTGGRLEKIFIVIAAIIIGIILLIALGEVYYFIAYKNLCQ